MDGGKRCQSSRYATSRAYNYNEQNEKKLQKPAPAGQLEPPTEDGQPLR